jgi:methionyl-tRNA formyltransferase
MVTHAPLRVAFFGTPEFAVPALRTLIESRHIVVGVVSQPDRPRGRGRKLGPGPTKVVALEHKIPVLQPEKMRDEGFIMALRALDADLGVVAAYGRILTDTILAVPRLGMINVHASLLPRYRGAAPVHRAVMNGDAKTGVTIMRVVKALDAGPMMARVERPIAIDESSDVVERDLAALGAGLLVTVVDDLAAGRAREVPQNDAEATYAPRLTKEEGLLDFAAAAMQVHNKIRGLRPWPTAFTVLRGKRLAIHQARISAWSGAGVASGTCVAASGDKITIACGDARAVDILQLQPEGRRTMGAREYLAGHGLLAGERFG